MSRRGVPAASALLYALPIAVLLVPQGTVQRTLVPEAAFVGLLLLVLTLVAAQARHDPAPAAITRRQFHPSLLVALAYFLVLNPLWSVFQGNAPARVAMTTLPFVLLGLHYAIALRRFGPAECAVLLRMLMASAALAAAVVIVNYLVADLSGSAQRSTGIEGAGTLTLPILPMGAALLSVLALAESDPRRVRTCGAAAAVVVVAMLMTVTRAMLLGYLVGVVVGAALLWPHGHAELRRRLARRFGLGLLVVAAVGAPFAAQWLSRIDPTSDGDVSTILGRLDEYAAFWDAFTASPLLGRGMGFLATYPSDFDFTLRDAGITVCHSHFFFLAGTTGVLGLALYYGLIGNGLWLLWRQLRAAAGRRTANHGALLAGLVAAIVAGTLFTLTSTTFTTLSYVVFQVIFLYAARLDWAAAS